MPAAGLCSPQHTAWTRLPSAAQKRCHTRAFHVGPVRPGPPSRVPPRGSLLLPQTVAFLLCIDVSPSPPSSHLKRALRPGYHLNCPVAPGVIYRHKDKASKLIRTPNQLLERGCILLSVIVPCETNTRHRGSTPSLCVLGALVQREFGKEIMFSKHTFIMPST